MATYTAEGLPRPKKVFCNGVELRYCFFVDTRRGIADCYREPLSLDKYHIGAVTKRHRGKIEVQF